MNEPFVVKEVVRLEEHQLNSYTDGLRLVSTDERLVDLMLYGDCCSISFFEKNSIEDLE